MNKHERSRRSFRFNSLESLETRALLTMAPTAQLPAVNVELGATPPTVDLDSYFKDSAAAANSYAIINTNLGTIPVVLTPKTMPTTVANFLSDVNKGDYKNTLVDSSIPGSVWAAGKYKIDANSNITASSVSTATPATSAADNEVGGSNVRGTIAMIRSATGSESGSSQFFFNESDSNASAIDQQIGGSSVFGHVVGEQGLAAMDAIGAVPVPASSPLNAPLDKAPLQFYTPGQPVQTYNLTTISSVTTASEVYQTVSDNPAVATVAITGDQLSITPVAAGTAHVAVVAYGSDGTPATEVFNVNVDGWTAGTTPPPNIANPVSTVVTAPVALPVAPLSDFTPTVEGSFPSSVMVGQRSRIQQTVTLTNPALGVPQGEVVSLGLSRTGDAADYLLATSTTKSTLKVGKPAKLTLTSDRLNSAVPAGSYHVVVTVTDPAGGKTTLDTGKTLIVIAPYSKTSAK